MNPFDEILRSIGSLAKNEQPISDISKLLYEHKCFFLLSKIKAKNEYTERIKTETMLNRICTVERYQACRDIFDSLESSGIPYSVIKGAVLSKAAYGDIKYRKSGDIDLLVNRKDIDRIKHIMRDAGFIQGRVGDNGITPFSRRELLFQSAMSHQTAPFIKKAGHPLCPYVNVDINMDVMWGESKLKTDMDYVLSQTEETSICGVRARKLSCEMEFISFCLHHYKDMNSIYLLSQGALNLSLFCDIYFYIKNTVPDAAMLKAICVKLDVADYIYYCVFYTNQIFNDSLLDSYLSALKTEKSEGILNTFGLQMDEIRQWNIGFFERLFTENINSYFSVHLQEKDFEKIEMNKNLM